MNFKLSEEELNLHSAKRNAAAFIEVVKDIVCDWINYNNVKVPSRDHIQILYLSFFEKNSAFAIARVIDKDCDFENYRFNVSLDYYFGQSKGISVNVYDSNGAKVTNNWNWLNYLGFDKKGYSYELTKKEYYYLEDAHQHMSLEDVKKFCVSFNEASKVFKDFRKGGH